MKKIILLSTLVILGGLVLCQSVYAANANVFVFPATASKNVSTTFSALVKLDPQENKVCVVKGILNFSNLTCQSVSVASGLIVQKAPTCQSPSFVLGVPKCTTIAQNILTVSMKGSNVGQAILSLTGVNVIGAGTAVAFSGENGTYNITAASAATPKQKTPVSQSVEQPAETQQVQTTVNQTVPGNVGAASFSSIAAAYFWPLLIILIIICVGYGIYYFLKKKNSK